MALVHDDVIGILAVALSFSLDSQGRYTFIDELFVEEYACGQGLGREALEAAEAYYR